MAIVENGRRAVTHYEVLRTGAKWSIVECRLETGRTHQIRVHMASINTPVVGDLLYNRKSTGTEQARHKLGIIGHALHAARLSFTHPVEGNELQFEAPLPADLERLLLLV